MATYMWGIFLYHVYHETEWTCVGIFMYLWDTPLQTHTQTNPKPWKQLSDVLETNSLTLMNSVEIFFKKFQFR